MKRILVANRGEIACRILQSIRAAGLTGIAVFSDADKDAPHVALADQAIPIGPAPSAESYLNQAAILNAAKLSRADAIHPGYGFLSENSAFAEAVLQAGLIFIGPSPTAIEQMGDKATARQIMAKAGVPCVPGYDGADQSDAALIKAAKEIGFPLLVKAAAGGGGRGMRLVVDGSDLPEALHAARSEAMTSFGSDGLILERAITDARHIEFQVFGDNAGTILHLGERDCSLQRRHQKVIEEAPAPGMTDGLRAKMGAVAVKAAQAVKYVGAGTVEFLLAADGSFYFLEMNTRLQVEHPVTEAVTGLDLVALQLKVATGAPLGLNQSDIVINGHAIEARLYTEDPAEGFLPSMGAVLRWKPARHDGLRIDAGITQGSVVTPHYDPMQAKIIAFGTTREQARQGLLAGVEDTVLLGPITNADFLSKLLSLPEFIAGKATTDLLDNMPPPKPTEISTLAVCTSAALMLHSDQTAMLDRSCSAPSLAGWSNAPLPPVPIALEISGARFDLTATAKGTQWVISLRDETHSIEPVGPDRLRIDGHFKSAVWHAEAGSDAYLAMDGACLHAQRIKPWLRPDDATISGKISAPLPGRVIQIEARLGQHVQTGALLAVIEAMKMQHKIIAPCDGKVLEIGAKEGSQVNKGDIIATLEPDAKGDT